MSGALKYSRTLHCQRVTKTVRGHCEVDSDLPFIFLFFLRTCACVCVKVQN
ncbi:hypothetical protein CCP3SC1AL1_1390006 [Gammaproteobacteria bacterium]